MEPNNNNNQPNNLNQEPVEPPAQTYEPQVVQPSGVQPDVVQPAPVEPADNTQPNNQFTEPVSPVVPPIVQPLGTPQSFQSQEAVSSSPDLAATSPAASNQEYLSNPFLNGVRGLVLTLKSNPVSSLMTGFIGIVLYGIGYLGFLIALTSGNIAITVIISLLLIVLAIVVFGAYYAIGGSSARNETISTSEAMSRAFKKALPLIGLSIINGIIVGIGFLLLIVPGVILMARTLLAPLVLFEENLGPIAALKRSFALTKGHVNEMLGALFASSLLGGSFNLLLGATSVAPLVGRYNDLHALQESGAPKPKTHWLNYLYLLGIVLLAGVIAFVIVSAANTKDSLNTNTPVYINNGTSETVPLPTQDTSDPSFDSTFPSTDSSTDQEFFGTN